MSAKATEQASLHTWASIEACGHQPELRSIPGLAASKGHNALSGHNFWRRTAGSITRKQDRDGTLPFDFTYLSSGRLEPLVKFQPWSSKNWSVEPQQRSPSPHWRPVLDCNARAPVPVHRLFDVAQVSTGPGKISRHVCNHEQPKQTDDQQPQVLPQVSHLSLCASIEAAWQSVRQLQKPWSDRLPLQTAAATGRAAFSYAATMRVAVQSNVPSTKHLPVNEPVASGGLNDHGHTLNFSTSSDDEAWLKWKDVIDLTHGTQGVISKLSSTLHGPGGGMRQLPVVDLTDCVPCRMRQRQGLAGSISCSSTGRCKHTTPGPDLDAEWTHTVLAPGMVCPAAVDTLMSSVHAVSEVLHILAKFQPALSQNLFHDLIDWSTQLARQRFVTEIDFAIPKSLVDRVLAELRGMGKAVEHSDNPMNSTCMDENREQSSPLMSWAGAVAKCNGQINPAEAHPQESIVATAIDTAPSGTANQDSTPIEPFLVRGSTASMSQETENCPPYSSRHIATDTKGVVHFTCPPQSARQGTDSAEEVGPGLHQKRMEWKAHGMSQTLCYRLGDSCTDVLQATKGSRPVTARADQALEIFAKRPLLLKGLACNRGNVLLLPRKWQQVENVAATSPARLKSRWQLHMNAGIAQAWVQSRYQQRKADVGQAVGMHGWDEVQETITMTPAYNPCDNDVTDIEPIGRL